MNNKAEYSITGFIIGIIVISMFSVSLGLFISDMQVKTGVTGNTSIINYNKSLQVQALAENVS